MTGRYKAYPEYKESGVEWLGYIPADWTVGRLKNALRIRNGRDYKDVEVSNGGFPVYGSGGVFKRSSDFLYDGDSVLFGRKGTVDSPLCVSGKFWTVDTMFYSELKPKMNAKFIHAQSLLFPYDLLSTNTALPSMTQEDLLELAVLLPSLSEQQKIAAFLDHETSKIDTLIAKQEKLIELLKEKRQAVISHAVTKGLNPDAPMKDSGVEWLGEVPEHWVKTKLVNIGDGTKGCFVNGPFGSDLLAHELMDEGVPVIYIRDIKPTGYLRKSTVHVTLEKALQLKVCRVQAGDILVSKVGDPPGDSCVYPISEPEAIITQDVIRIRINKGLFNAAFVSYLLNSDFGRIVLNDISVEGTRKRVSLGDFKATKLVFPSLLESIEIVEYLDNECTRIDSIISRADSAVTLMKERRTALISAAVTGKIDVRDWQSQGA
ncbi:MAG: restriction endonuclease subunit S [Oceanospirillum sp.]|nr:restriction endonuclease subunit S [Oceanospirillum sp.]